MTDIIVRNLAEDDWTWIQEEISPHRRPPFAFTRNRIVEFAGLPGFVAEKGGERAGSLLYRLQDKEFEVVAIACTMKGAGVGKALMDAARDLAVKSGANRLWLCTSNDNTRAIRFYQIWGLSMAALHKDSFTRLREKAPDLPERGQDGIEVRHDVEFELWL